MQESLTVTYVIDEMDGRDLAISDVPGAFLQTDMVHGDHTVCIRLCGILADLLVSIDPLKFVHKFFLEGGQKVIYAVPKKALYGALIASLIFWWDLSDALLSWGFEPNPHDICFMKKTVNGKLCTICWNVDYLKILYVIPKVLDGVLYQLTSKYRNVLPLSVNRGCVHYYGGMRLDYGIKGKRCASLYRITSRELWGW